MAKLLYYDVLQYQPENIAFLESHFEVLRLLNPDHDNDDVLANADVLLAPLGWRVDAKKMDRCPRLKAIASNTTSITHIDVEAAQARNIRVIALQTCKAFLNTITPTAEHTWGLLLAVLRRTPWAHQSAMNGTWNRRLFPGPRMLSSMSLGLVGLGRLGKMVARYGHAFGMELHYYDPHSDYGELSLIRHSSLESLVSSVDIVSLHVSQTPETRGLLNGDVLRKFRRGSYLINTSFGEVLDEGSLLACLQDGHIAGTGLDVLSGEFVPGFSNGLKDHPLVEFARTNDAVVLTPHIGGSTIDAWRMTERHTLETIQEFLK
ncbi:NAD(P)-binding domain-containing protein [Nitrospiraceae bacterium AH_259_D15_M11_P09]|nr:NAD(P)-binding domain-containing protein [Nitrospiraceae bacterium AH_259_D15_M11_P09]